MKPERKEKIAQLREKIIAPFTSKDGLIGLIERNIGYVLLFVILTLLHIENRYTYERKRAELDQIIEKRTLIESQTISLHNQFNNTSSRTAVLKKLREKGSSISEAGEPTIIID